MTVLIWHILNQSYSKIWKRILIIIANEKIDATKKQLLISIKLKHNKETSRLYAELLFLVLQMDNMRHHTKSHESLCHPLSSSTTPKAFHLRSRAVATALLKWADISILSRLSYYLWKPPFLYCVEFMMYSRPNGPFCHYSAIQCDDITPKKLH